MRGAGLPSFLIERLAREDRINEEKYFSKESP